MQGAQPIGAAHRAEAEEGDDENLAERRIGDRPRPAGIGPARRDRGQAQQQDRPAADRHQINAGGAASAKQSKAARLTASPASSPAAVTRNGPTRPSPSPPRSASAASLCRLVAIWMSMLPISAASTAAQAILCSAAQASVAPTATGAIDRLSVRGRAASSQGERGIVAIGAAVDGMRHNSPLRAGPKAARRSCNSRAQAPRFIERSNSCPR